MAKFDNISNIEIENKVQSPAPIQNRNKTSVNQWKISCEYVRYKRCISVLVCIILIPIIVTVPTVLVHKRKMKIDTTTEVPLHDIITNTTKWKQNGITVFHQISFDETGVDFNPLDIDDSGSIYMAESSQNRVIEIKLNITGFSIVAGGSDDPDEDGIYPLWKPADIIVDQKTDSIIICDAGNTRIVRWSRKNTANREIMISDVFCNGLALDDNGYLYVSIGFLDKQEVRRWKIGVKNESTLIAGGNTTENHFAQLKIPMFLFIDKDYSLYVVDQSNHRVMKWMKNAKTGIVVAGGNGPGNDPKQLFRPSGVVVDHLDNVYVTDTNNNRVMRWLKGAKEGSIVVGGNGQGNETDQLWAPSDLLFDQHGNLYVFDAANHRIQKFVIESNSE